MSFSPRRSQKQLMFISFDCAVKCCPWLHAFRYSKGYTDGCVQLTVIFKDSLNTDYV